MYHVYLLLAPCEINPCQNSGRCEFNDDGQYSCICERGYSGINCEQSMSTNDANFIKKSIECFSVAIHY